MVILQSILIIKCRLFFNVNSMLKVRLPPKCTQNHACPIYVRPKPNINYSMDLRQSLVLIKSSVHTENHWFYWLVSTDVFVLHMNIITDQNWIFRLKKHEWMRRLMVDGSVVVITNLQGEFNWNYLLCLYYVLVKVGHNVCWS